MSGPPIAAVFMGLFGGSEEPDIEAIADRLGSRPTEGDVKRTLGELEESLDRLAAAADIAGPDGRVENDAPPADKARELAMLVERGRLSIDRPVSGGQGGGGSEGDGVVATVADDVSRSKRPSGHRAASLLDALATPSATGEGAVREALSDAVDRLEAADDIDRAIEPEDPERTAGRLTGVDDDLAAGVARMAEAAGVDGDAAATEVEDARVVVDRALGRIDGPQPRRDATLAERVELLAEAATDADSGSVADGAPGSEAARRVRANNRAECEPARDLLDGVASDDPEEVADALREGVDALNEAATVRNLTADVDAEDVAARVRSLGETVSGIDGPVADALGDRVDRLEAMLDRADASNAVVPYAVREEVAFYERDLLPLLESGTTGGGADTDVTAADGSVGGGAVGGDVTGDDAGTAVGDAGAAVDALDERRQEIRTRYVDSRTDHNHSIPMFFLSLTETMEEHAREALSAGEQGRARGIASAADDLLDRVEALYERNEYSVMLRRLRG
ncbi:hypothetical protein [Halobaculum magnesiiphilum]|uniref:Uncharacterized protein n=1 Tax=Halobaculum magnesiiphilum TaxID=1017351 RepID=A0A8T8WHZ5_9EURY|nr:hypothetical protein [Halobaculum magnesiiphilum]QZP39469.1 hypothetical protein K6T50_17965 [Halobaculum magnesiiphilum]